MIDALVTQRREEAEDICSFELAALDGTALPSFEPGSHIDVVMQEGITRQYSLCPEAAQAGRYLIAVLRESQSRGGSAAMHRLHTGDRVRISVPRNLFALAGGAAQSLLFAGGIGITPLLAMAEHLQRGGEDFKLHYCGRALPRMAFADRIQNGPLAQHTRLHLDDGAVEQKLDLDFDLGPRRPDTHIYVCGPTGFMDWVLAGARARGWPEEQLHREYFAAPAPTGEASDAPFQIQIGREGATYTVPAGCSAVEVLAQHGIEIPVSCEQGVCGTCLTGVIEGVPDHRDAFLTDAEHAANNQFTPCCSRARSDKLVLDL